MSLRQGRQLQALGLGTEGKIITESSEAISLQNQGFPQAWHSLNQTPYPNSGGRQAKIAFQKAIVKF